MLEAKNSNDCSTHRCTTHQRQKSVSVNDLSIPADLRSLAKMGDGSYCTERWPAKDGRRR